MELYRTKSIFGAISRLTIVVLMEQQQENPHSHAHTHTFARSSILTLLLTDSAKLLALPIASLSWPESLCRDCRLGLREKT